MNFINVTQGHENSIGLEVFIKSFLVLDSKNQKKIRLFTYKKTLEKNLKQMRLNYKIDNDSVYISNAKLNLIFLESNSARSESFCSLVEAEKNTKKGDVLVTLPTTKSSLTDGSYNYTGHTDYFRKKYVDKTPVMLFKSENFFMALLSEHIRLGEVENYINMSLVEDKIAVLASNPYFLFEEFVFSGVNPHCGEDGLLGETDNRLIEIIKYISRKFAPIFFKGPISGDTIFLDSRDSSLKTCIICSAHDQGLAPFKALSGLQAVNITLGLPFLRLSPDHGTAFNLYGKDKANYLGTLYTLKLALENVGSR